MEATSLDLEIGGHRIGVSCGTPAIADRLRSALAEHLIRERAPLGFVVRVPTKRTGLFVLTDRCGFVFARSRHAEHMVASLAELLSGFREPPSGCVRFVDRALVRGHQAVLCVFPVTFAPALIERRLHATGFAVLDRLAVDIDDVGRVVMAPSPWSSLTSVRPADAHVRAVEAPTVFEVPRVFVPAFGPSPSAVDARLIATLAGSGVTGTPSDRLERAARVLEAAEVVAVDIGDERGLYRALSN